MEAPSSFFSLGVLLTLDLSDLSGCMAMFTDALFSSEFSFKVSSTPIGSVILSVILFVYSEKMLSSDLDL